MVRVAATHEDDPIGVGVAEDITGYGSTGYGYGRTSPEKH